MQKNNSINITVSAKDEASAKLKAMSSNLKQNMQVVSASALVAGGAMTAFFASAVKGASGAEMAQAQLEHAVLNVSKANQEQLESTMALADALEAKGVLDGDNIKMGLAQLSTFGLSNKAVQGLAGSMADLAVNQFGVNASGDQLSQTANIMAKALQGQFGVLEKSGIRFTEAQQKMIMYGSEMEKVTALNEGLAQNLKLTNEVARQTSEGAFSALKVQAENVSESIGAVLLPKVKELANNLIPVIQNVISWVNANPELFTTIVQVTAGMAGLLTAIGGLGLILPVIGAGFSALGAVIGVLFSPITLIVTAIGALTAGIIYLYNTNERFRNTVQDVWGSVSSFMVNAMAKIKETILLGMEIVKQKWKDDWGNIRTTLADFVSWMNGTALPMAKIFMQEFLAGMRILAQGIRDNWGTIQAIFTVATTHLVMLVTSMATVIKATIKVMMEVMHGVLTAGVALLRGEWKKAWDIMVQTVVNIGSTIKEAVIELFTNLVSQITNFVSAFYEAGKNMIRGLIDGMIAMFPEAVTAVQEGANEIMNGIKNSLGIHSPSTVFMEYGKNTMEGMALGIQGASLLPLQRMDELAEQLKGKNEKIVQNLTTLSEGYYSSLDSIDRSLGDFADAHGQKIEQINEQISSIGREMQEVQKTYENFLKGESTSFGGQIVSAEQDIVSLQEKLAEAKNNARFASPEGLDKARAMEEVAVLQEQLTAKQRAMEEANRIMFASESENKAMIAETEANLQRMIVDARRASNLEQEALMQSQINLAQQHLEFYRSREGQLTEQRKSMALGVADARRQANNSELQNFLETMIAKRNEMTTEMQKTLGDLKAKKLMLEDYAVQEENLYKDTVNAILDQRARLVRQHKIDMQDMYNATEKSIMDQIALYNALAEAVSRSTSGGSGRSAPKASVGKRATGGTVSEGTPYIVGERRPELFVPDQRGTILPDARGAGGGAVHNIYITGNTFLDESSAEKIGDMFFNQYRLNMKF